MKRMTSHKLLCLLLCAAALFSFCAVPAAADNDYWVNLMPEMEISRKEMDTVLPGEEFDLTITVRNIKVSAGAGFLVALTGEIMTMPGLPKVPAAEKIDVDNSGKISGLF